VRLVIAAGPPASGKTAVLARTLGSLVRRGLRVTALKCDCLVSHDHEAYRAAGVEARLTLSRDLCPDHHTAVAIGDFAVGAAARGADLAVVETAGLCDRCSPFLRRVPSLCILSTACNLRAPAKMRPLVQGADFAVLTKGELVSQAEREVLRAVLRRLRPGLPILEVNGLTGEGVDALATWLRELPPLELLPEEQLRHPLPRGNCTLCRGGSQ
jgi:Ni2+-binding GTPase involved in maturation of urease and hydrogenase